jgi:hypothetical protein
MASVFSKQKIDRWAKKKNKKTGLENGAEQAPFFVFRERTNVLFDSLVDGIGV